MPVESNQRFPEAAMLMLMLVAALSGLAFYLSDTLALIERELEDY